MNKPSPEAPGLTLYDERALLAHAQPLRPEYGPDVAASLAFNTPGLRLALRATKRTSRYEAWLWSDQNGQAYFSKRMTDGRTLAWKPGVTIERALRKNRTMHRTSTSTSTSTSTDKEGENK